MSDSQSGSPIQVIIVVLLLAGGGWFFFNRYEVDGLDGVSVSPRGSIANEDDFFAYGSPPAMIDGSQTLVANRNPSLVDDIGGATLTSGGPSTLDRATDIDRPVVTRRQRYPNIKIASWAMDGFGPTKLASVDARKYVSAVVRRYDVIAVQQIASIERDLIPRLVDVINGADRRYDYVLGSSTGPKGRQEQLAFIFDTRSVIVDRKQSYTLADPSNELTYDPMLGSFRASAPTSDEAFTFSLINMRVDLAKAADEVALLPGVVQSVLNDGRGEDDVMLVGLFQADDAYLLPSLGEGRFVASVRHRSTDVFGKFQTSNLLIQQPATSEFLGRGGVFDYRREYDLNPIQAEAVTSHLPVFAEFTAHEGGEL